MGDALLLAADCAYPFDYTRLPKGCGIVLGYIGQQFCTPNVWTVNDVLHVRNTGRLWAPIHTPPQAPFTADMGRQAANLMISELERYPLVGGEPVFLDIEHLSWAPNPAEAMRGVTAWAEAMRGHGHRQAHAYLPWAARAGWGANWTDVRPSSIPAEYIGWQYQGHVDHDRYDLSVFRLSVFQDLINRTKDYPVNLDHDAQKFIVDQLALVQTNLHEIMWAYYEDADPKRPHPYAQRRLAERLDHLATAVANLGTGAVNVDELATALAAKLGPTQGAALVAALGHALSNG